MLKVSPLKCDFCGLWDPKTCVDVYRVLRLGAGINVPERRCAGIKQSDRFANSPGARKKKGCQISNSPRFFHEALRNKNTQLLLVPLFHKNGKKVYAWMPGSITGMRSKSRRLILEQEFGGVWIKRPGAGVGLTVHPAVLALLFCSHPAFLSCWPTAALDQTSWYTIWARLTLSLLGRSTHSFNVNICQTQI